MKDQHLFISKQMGDTEKLKHDHQRMKGLLDDALNGSTQLEMKSLRHIMRQTIHEIVSSLCCNIY